MYVNWKGQARIRRVLPHSFRFGHTEWHPEEQWLILATDLEDCEVKEFALNGIKSSVAAEDQSLPWRK
jgi:hypothetical protein